MTAIINFEALRKHFPIKKDIGTLGLCKKQLEWAQVVFWQLKYKGEREKREISWDEIYKALGEMKGVYRAFKSCIGPARTVRLSDKKISDSEIELTRKLLLLGDIDTVIDFYLQRTVAI